MPSWLKSSFFPFLKVGAVGFGGGSALIPVIERELVERRASISEEDYLKHTVVANITPGALPVKLGASCGQQLSGPAGSLSGAYAVALPGVLLTVASMALFSVLGEGAIAYFNYASVGITAFIVFLLTAYVRKTLAAGQFKLNLLLAVAAFLLTGGKEVRELLGLLVPPEWLGTPLLDISTIDLMLLSFFLILLHVLLPKRLVMAGGVLLGLAYAFCAGKTGAALGWTAAKPWLGLAMAAALLSVFLLRPKQGKTKHRLHIPGAVFLTVGLFLGTAALFTAAAAATTGISVIGFIGKVALSTLTSFGGGEAYVSVADGFFVQGGYIPPELFYTRLVPLANAFPGPILIKVAAGIGYLFGLESASPLAGWLTAAAAAATAIGVCSSLAVLFAAVYDSVRDSALVRGLKQYILPVICGMLVSTSCAMLYTAAEVMAGKAIPGWAGVLSLAAAVVLLFLITARRHIQDILLLLASAAVSLAVLAIL